MKTEIRAGLTPALQQCFIRCIGEQLPTTGTTVYRLPGAITRMQTYIPEGGSTITVTFYARKKTVAWEVYPYQKKKEGRGIQMSHYCVSCGDIITKGVCCEVCVNEESARRRVADDAALAPYANIILADWPNWAEHMAWLATASTEEIVNWADGIHQNEEPADEDYNR